MERQTSSEEPQAPPISSPGAEPAMAEEDLYTDAARQAMLSIELDLQQQARLDSERNERARQAGIAAGRIVLHKGVWTAAGRLTEKQLGMARTETARYLEQQEMGAD